MLDMFDISNGYPGDEAAGSPTFKSATYNDKFKERFLEAQANRNADLLHEAQNIWSDINAGKSEVYPDDMPFVVPGADGAARLWQADTSLVNCTKNPQIFLTHTGTQNPSPGPICSVRIPSASAEDDDSFALSFESLGSGLAWRACAAHQWPLRSDQRRYHGYRLRLFGHEHRE